MVPGELGRLYIASFKAIAHTVITDLMWIGSPTDAATLIWRILVTQRASETSEQLPFEIFRTTTDNSAQGSAVTPAPYSIGDPAYGGVVRRTITGGSLSTVSTDLESQGENVLNGFLWVPTGRPIILSPTAGTAGRLAVKLAVAPAASLDLDMNVLLEEVGG